MSTHVKEQLSAYLDGELPEAERRAADSHLRGCDECARHLEDLAAVDEMARALPVEAPVGYFDALPGRVRFRMTRERRSFRLPAWSWAVAAAALLAVVAPRVLDRRPAPGMVGTAPAPDTAPAAAPAAPPVAATPGDRGADALGQSTSPRQAEVAAGAGGTPGRDVKAPAARDEQEAREKLAFAPAPSAVPTPLRPASRRLEAVEPKRSAPAPSLAAGSKAQEPPSGAAGDKRDIEEEKLAKAAAPKAAPTASGARPSSANRSDAPANTFARAPEEPPVEGPAGQHLPTVAAEKDVAETPSEDVEAKKEDSRARATGTTGLRDTDAHEKRRRPLGFRALLALPANDVTEARRAREQWRAFLEQSPAAREADEARVRIVEMGVKAWRFSNDPADLTLLRQDAEAYLRRDDAAQGDRVRSLLRTTGN